MFVDFDKVDNVKLFEKTEEVLIVNDDCLESAKQRE